MIEDNEKNGTPVTFRDPVIDEDEIVALTNSKIAFSPGGCN